MIYLRTRKIFVEPQFTITPGILNRVIQISEKLIRLEYLPQPSLNDRREARMYTIQAMLAMDGTMVPFDLITGIWEGLYDVVLSSNDMEVKNAIRVYRDSDYRHWDVYSYEQLKTAYEQIKPVKHQNIFRGGVRADGTDAFGIRVKKSVSPDSVDYTMKGLLQWLKDTDVHPLVAAPAFHYEMEHLHPFSYGNSRVGWLWQMLLLKRWNKRFACIPIEKSVYYDFDYYVDQINYSAKNEDCAAYIEYMLQVILNALSAELCMFIDMPKSPQGVLPERLPGNILKELKQNPNLSKTDLAAMFSRSPDLIKYHLQRLVKKGAIRHNGPAKGGYWTVLKKIG